MMGCPNPRLGEADTADTVASPPHDEDDDGRVIARCLRELRAFESSRVRSHRRLAGSASGSRVFELTLDGDETFVLKMTTAAGGDRGLRELRFYQECACAIPLRTPRLIAGGTTGMGTSVLLSAVRISPAAADWTAPQWVRAAQQLGRLHHRSVAAALAGRRWLQPSPSLLPAQREAAREQWEVLGRERVAGRLLDDLDRLAGAVEAPPACLRHGDCHAANLLLDPADGELVWTDWQEVCLGHGPEDLALLWQRGEADGGTVPRQEMLAAYAGARELPLNAVLQRAAVAAEIQLLLFGWPPFLRVASRRTREVLFSRLERLAEAWAG